MAQTDTADLVTAAVVARELGVPLRAVYRMAEKGRIPCVDLTEPWHERKQFRFNLEAVRTTLASYRRAS